MDFAVTMIETAAEKHPEVQFKEGDAEELPYEDASFDAVVCAFGLLHLEHPERAIAEARCVLRAGGRYTFTVWCSPEAGGALFRLVMRAIQRHGTPDVPLPPAPPIFRFADFQECTRTLTAAGFAEPALRIIQPSWRAKNAQDVLDLIYKSMVRTPMILEAQDPQARKQIEQAIVEGAEEYRQEGGVVLQFPALLATAATA